jgi:uncharacterized protein YciI
MGLQMKTTLAVLLAFLLLTRVMISGTAGQKSEPQFKLVEFHLALLKKGPRWTGEETAAAVSLEREHKGFVTSLLASGKAIIAGPLNDTGEIRGVYIFRAPTAEAAKAWAESDPAVRSGHLLVEMHPWWAEDVMKKTSSTAKMSTAYLAFLRRGPKWTAEKTAETEELQKAHLANIVRLNELRKLVVAGPFGDDGTLRGMFVFRVDSLAEAETLAATDPAVKAGRLTLDLHPWVIPEDILP